MQGSARGPDQALVILVNALNQRGLAAYVHEIDGASYVHVSPPRAPAAGTDLQLVVRGGRCCWFTEWGGALGGQLTAVIQHVTWWFGKSSPRP